MSAKLPVLYSYWRSTAAYRVRIALNLKQIDYRLVTIDLVKDGGRQHQPDYQLINPTSLVPSLEIDGQVLTQSLAICEYLEDTVQGPALLPAEPGMKAFARALAQDIACDMHPLNNLRVQQYLKKQLGVSAGDSLEWMDHWMQSGFSAIEKKLEKSAWTGEFCMGQQPGLADIYLVAQGYNADRFSSDLSAYPLLNGIIDRCRKLDPFIQAAPERQPDAPDAT